MAVALLEDLAATGTSLLTCCEAGAGARCASRESLCPCRPGAGHPRAVCRPRAPLSPVDHPLGTRPARARAVRRVRTGSQHHKRRRGQEGWPGVCAGRHDPRNLIGLTRCSQEPQPGRSMYHCDTRSQGCLSGMYGPDLLFHQQDPTQMCGKVDPYSACGHGTHSHGLAPEPCGNGVSASIRRRRGWLMGWGTHVHAR